MRGNVLPVFDVDTIRMPQKLRFVAVCAATACMVSMLIPQNYYGNCCLILSYGYLEWRYVYLLRRCCASACHARFLLHSTTLKSDRLPWVSAFLRGCEFGAGLFEIGAKGD